jgi:myo-inositol catabolism protein IolS
MKRVKLGGTGVEVAAISVGTWAHGGPNVAGGTSVGWSGHDDAKAQDALLHAFERGLDHWDTADVYGDGHAEALIGGLWDRVPRSAIFLASKVGWDPGPHGHFYHPTFMRRQLERSLRNLRTDVIDLYYLHHCDFGPEDRHFEPALAQLRAFQAEGKIRFIGLSDWNSSRIMRFIDGVDPDVVQPYRNVQDDAWESSGLAAWVRSHHRGAAFFSPLKHGLLLGKYDAPLRFPEGDFRRNVGGFEDPAVIEAMKARRAALAARFSGHPEPVLHGVVDALLTGEPTACVLLGMRTRAQVEAAAALGEALTDHDARWVKDLYQSEPG